MKPTRLLLTAALTGLLLAGCASRPAPAPVTTAAPATTGPALVHPALLPVLYQQTAAEYEATVRGIYHTARLALNAALADPSWHALTEPVAQGFEQLPPAIIVDADETVIDNSAYLARKIKLGEGHTDADFAAWAEERRATALPGAVEFLQEAARRGVRVYYVTNRDLPQTVATAENLAKLGFPDAVPAQVLARDGVSEKSARRLAIAAKHRVILMFGDNLGDFTDCYKPRPQGAVESCTGLPASTDAVTMRREVIRKHGDWWGVRWFMLPNPSYGSWESALYDFKRPADPADARRAAEARLDLAKDAPAP
ncbi:MAG: acid phosphatase [Xanthomonadales bacterium]|jgi:acid phosphatase|nr:acid phosphatase [Xanthomonadales bacterium]